jgi:hypothetical protein
LIDLVPAWTTNRLNRLAKRAKRYLTDPAIALAAARVDGPSVLRDGDLLGRLIDTFVVAQLRPEVALRHPFDINDRIWALPICALWAART